jgi:hypothetical protein
MSVIIDEFDVVVEPPPTGPRTAEADGPPPPAPPRPLRPMDLRDVLAHEARRASRLRAH